MKCCRQKLYRKSKHTFCVQKLFFWISYHVWGNKEKYGTAIQTTNDYVTQRMRFACWINKAVDTHSEPVIFNAFPLPQLLSECASVLSFTYIDCFVCIKSGQFISALIAPDYCVVQTDCYNTKFHWSSNNWWFWIHIYKCSHFHFQYLQNRLILAIYE